MTVIDINAYFQMVIIETEENRIGKKENKVEDV